jgi:hypothetical protein
VVEGTETGKLIHTEHPPGSETYPSSVCGKDRVKNCCLLELRAAM